MTDRVDLLRNQFSSPILRGNTDFTILLSECYNEIDVNKFTDTQMAVVSSFYVLFQCYVIVQCSVKNVNL